MRKRSIAVVLAAEIGQYNRAMDEVSRKTKETADDGEKASKKFGDGWAEVGKPLMAVGGALTAITAASLKTGISYNQLQQQSRAAMTTLLGSAQAANAQMDQLDEFARTSPFAKQTFITAQQQMLAFGIEAQKVVPYLDAIQDSVAAAGGNTQTVGELAFIMAQISAASKITGQDLIQFGQRGVNAAELIGSQMGMTGAQIRAEITAGTLDADKALDALAAGMTQSFDGAAANVKNTLSGAFDRVAAAWRDLSSEFAEPLVGTEGGGAAVAGLNMLADLMRDFQGMSSEFKQGVTWTMALAGATTMAAGAYLTLAPRIRAAGDAARAIGGAYEGVYNTTTEMTKVIGLATAAFLAHRLVVESGVLATDTMTASTNEFVRTLAGLDGAGGSASATLDNLFTGTGAQRKWSDYLTGLTTVTQSVDGLDSALEAIREGSGGFWGWLQTGYGAGGDSRFEVATKQFESFDESLAKLHAQGRLEEAAHWHDEVAAAAERQGFSTKEVAELLPQYTSQLTDADLATQKAAKAVEFYLDKLGMTEDELGSFVSAAGEAAAGWVGIGDSVADASVSLGDWIKQMEDQAQALRDFEANAVRAGKNGLEQGLIQQLRALGPEGAFRMKQLADASEEEIARANAAWRDQSAVVDESKQAVIDYLAELSDIPPEVITNLIAKDHTAGIIDTVKNRFLNLSRGIEIPIRTHPIASGTRANGGITQYADGGISAYGNHVPRIPQLRESSQGAVLWSEPETNWEAYISGKHGMEDRNRAIWLQAGQRLGMLSAAASGGVAGAAPVSVAAGGAGSGGSTSMSLSLVGAQVAIDPHTNIATFVRGEIQVGLAAASRSMATAGRRG